MSVFGKAFGALTGKRDELQAVVDRDEALKLLCPPEQNRVTRVGINKRGRYHVFSAPVGWQDMSEWRPDAELSATQYRKLRALYESQQLVVGKGPPWCHLLYHKHE